MFGLAIFSFSFFFRVKPDAMRNANRNTRRWVATGLAVGVLTAGGDGSAERFGRRNGNCPRKKQKAHMSFTVEGTNRNQRRVAQPLSLDCKELGIYIGDARSFIIRPVPRHKCNDAFPVSLAALPSPPDAARKLRRRFCRLRWALSMAATRLRLPHHYPRSVLTSHRPSRRHGSSRAACRCTHSCQSP